MEPRCFTLFSMTPKRNCRCRSETDFGNRYLTTRHVDAVLLQTLDDGVLNLGRHVLRRKLAVHDSLHQRRHGVVEDAADAGVPDWLHAAEIRERVEIPLVEIILRPERIGLRRLR